MWSRLAVEDVACRLDHHALEPVGGDGAHDRPPTMSAARMPTSLGADHAVEQIATGTNTTSAAGMSRVNWSR